MPEEGSNKYAMTPSSNLRSILFCGAGAGLISDSIVHPIDTLRARLQVGGEDQKRGGRYRNIFDCAKVTIREEGLRGLYKGYGVVMATTLPAHALYFLAYEKIKGLLSAVGADTEQNASVYFAGGIAANMCAGIIWTPADVVKQRLQVQTSHDLMAYRSSWHAVYTIVQKEGRRGIFKGYWAAALTWAPYCGIYFTVYEKCKHIAFRRRPEWKESPPLPLTLACGVTAGAMGAVCTNPIDVAKTRFQVQGTTSSQAVKYRSFSHGFRTILKEEGIRGLTNGMWARMLWIAPASAITIAGYEALRQVVKEEGI
jgi:hypothetical protein